MADLRVPPHVIEAVLNHVSGHMAGVAGIYNRASYDKEKREALNLWAEHVMALVRGGPPWWCRSESGRRCRALVFGSHSRESVAHLVKDEGRYYSKPE
jgi:hypothetical protein